MKRVKRNKSFTWLSLLVAQSDAGLSCEAWGLAWNVNSHVARAFFKTSFKIYAFNLHFWLVLGIAKVFWYF